MLHGQGMLWLGAVVIQACDGNDRINHKFRQFRWCSGRKEGVPIVFMNDEMRLQELRESTGLSIDSEICTQFTQVQRNTFQIEEIFDLLIGSIIDTYLICQVFQVRRLSRMDFLPLQFIDNAL